MASFQTPAIRKDTLRPSGKLISFFAQQTPRPISEHGPLSSIKKSVGPFQANMPDLLPQGRSLNIAIKRIPALPHRYDPQKSALNDFDERYQYLMKRGIIKRIEKEEKIIFAELPGLSGVLIVYRSVTERNANPERLNLDKRELTQMPLLESEERLRLLNYQHNLINKIENLLSVPNLIFLDLYNNQIREINGLHAVPSLRVLMLGKNLIEKIKNLNTLTKLDVLDLHSNKLEKIENLSNLAELRVLNLANNNIAVLENLENLKSLTEINLRRNLIEDIKGIAGLSKLQRLFLSNNKLERLEILDILGNCSSLTELALDGNGVQRVLNYSAFVLEICKKINFLDMKKVTLEMKENVARTPKLVRNLGMMAGNLVGIIENEWRGEVERVKFQGPSDFFRGKESSFRCSVESGHAVIENESSLFIYGNALEVISKPELYESIISITFQYIQFDTLIEDILHSKLSRFTLLKKLTFKDNNLNSFTQLIKFDYLPTLTTLEISNNEIIFSTIFRSFVISRFANIEEINSTQVTESEKIESKSFFQSFNNILTRPSIFQSSTQKFNNQDTEAQCSITINSNNNANFSKKFINAIVHSVIISQSKASELEAHFELLSNHTAKDTIHELFTRSALTESSLTLLT